MTNLRFGEEFVPHRGKLFAMKGSPELIYCYITALKP